MIELALNDVVMVRGVGYGLLVECGTRKSVKIRKAVEQVEAKKEQPTPSIANLFAEVATVTTETSQLAIQTEPVMPTTATEQPPAVKPEQELTPADEIATVRLTPSQVLVYTCVGNLATSVKIRVKTFLSNRPEFSVEASITGSMDSLKKLVFERMKKEMGFFYNIRLIYPQCELRELSRPLYQQQIPCDAKLVMLAQTTFSLIAGDNATNIKLGRNNLTATKTGDQNYSTCFGNAQMESDGRYYWEFKLDNFCEVEDIFVGVANRTVDAQACPTHSGGYWGYMPLCAKRFSHEDTGNLIDYGYSHKVGEIVGVLLHIKKGQGTLAFFRGGMCCGKAFEGIPVPICPAVTLMGLPNTVVQVTMDPRAQLPVYDLA